MPPPDGLLLSDDLLFSSRITATAADHGLTMKVARSVPALLTLAKSGKPAGILIDLHLPGLILTELLAGLSEPGGQRPRVVAYGSHVAVDVLRAARAAGCDLVLPRSKFVEDLPSELPTWLAAQAEPEG